MWDDYEMIFYFFNCFSIKQPFPDYGMEFCMDKKKTTDNKTGQRYV